MAEVVSDQILTGNGSAVGGSGHLTVLQAQRDGTASGRIPGQGGGLANREGVSTRGDVEGVGIATGGSNSRECGDSQAGESAHRDFKNTK
jgi:hypothetical protein